MAMYLTGVEHEESGELLEAIKYYKRAIHLSPDVEQRIYMKPYEAKGLLLQLFNLMYSYSVKFFLLRTKRCPIETGKSHQHFGGY